MNSHDNVELEMKEPFTIRVEPPVSTKKHNVCLWFRRIITLDDVPNQKHHRPIFIIMMSILHVFMHLSTYVKINWRGQDFASSLYHLCMFFVPCMRPTPHNTRIHIVRCEPSIINATCYYDDVLKNTCFSFMYPHQMWRIVTVNLLHMHLYHLLANLFQQLLHGIPLERKYGSVRIAAIYWLSDLGADLSFMLKDTDKSGVGASGALYGLMLFLIVDRLVAMKMNTDRRFFILMQLVLLMSLPFAANILMIVIFNVTMAHSAHFGGGLVGFLCGVCMLGCPWPWNSEHNCISRMACQRIAFIFLCLYYVITIVIFFLMDAPIVESILSKS